MKTYTVQAGDTLGRISTISYGVSSAEALLVAANPALADGIVPGMVLTIPPGPTTAPGVSRVPATRENEVSVMLGGKLFSFWETMTLQRSLDSFDMFSLGAPFEPSVEDFREAFAPLSYQRAEVFVGGERIYTGTNVNNTTGGDDDSGFTVTAEGYALAGVLHDCASAGTLGLEFDDMNLRDIATEQAKPFGLTPVFDAPPGAAFERVAIGADSKILGFWAKLAGQRGLVIGNDTNGQPVFRQETTSPVVQRLEMGSSPVRSVAPEFNPQNYYSHVTVTTPDFFGLGGTKHTVANPFLQGIVRPLTFDAGDVEPGDEVTIANAKIGRMFANAIAFRVDLVGWRNALGQLWAPNTTIQLLAPRAQIYRETDLLIRSVTLTRTSHEDTASLLCVLPGGFAGRIPEALPWAA